jgi:murein DD-endopeptidase MepM/ murein hydrolase activator NlpD
MFVAPVDFFSGALCAVFAEARMGLCSKIAGVALAFASLAVVAGPTAAATPHGFIPMPSGPQDSVSESQRQGIWAEIAKARARIAFPKAGEHPRFQWPLRVGGGYSGPGFYVISSYVDQNPAFPDKVQDYSCGKRSYDTAAGYNHQGTDIAIFPDGWNLMAARNVEIVAAAPGTIVLKTDGNFDQSCDLNTNPWNAVYVQHDDGSVAWYGHMKNGSLTTKAVGARVVAGEFLGNVGSSGDSTGPHLHFEVYDSAQHLIDPYQGQCNTHNAESWWAAQPAYTVTRVNRAFTTSGIPSLSSCGLDGRLLNPGTLKEKTAFAPDQLAFFVGAVRDIEAGQAVKFTVRRPDGSVWRSYDSDPSTESYPASYWYTSFFLDPAEPSGVWLLEVTVNGSVAQSPFTVAPGETPVPNYTDLWWNPVESGWGVNLTHQGDIVFATWFTYDTDRGGMWLVMSEARLQTDGSYAGTIYRATGTPLAQINGTQAANLPLPVVGTGSFRFTTNQRGTFSYTVNGITQQKAIERMVFAAPPSCAMTAGSRKALTNYQDLWWNPSESGWGINLTHQENIMFVTWFTYGAGGRGQWLVASDVRKQSTGEYRGRLYRTRGTPFNQISGAVAVDGSPVDIGEISLTFADGENGRIDYTVDGVSQSKAIQRLVFAATAPLCR